MTTYFTVDAFPGQRFSGKIRQIRNAATTVQNVVTYDAVIDVDNTDLRLRPGHDGERHGRSTPSGRDVLAVPNAALRFHPPPRRQHRRRPRPRPASGTSGAPGVGTGMAPARRTSRPEARNVWVLRGGDAAAGRRPHRAHRRDA